MSSVAKIIAEQIGNRALFMIGAKDLVGSENSLTFKIGRNANSVSHIRVTLQPSDTYLVESIRVRKSRGVPESKILDNRDDVYFDMLREVISNLTGMATSL
jgi:hypothetical protein